MDTYKSDSNLFSAFSSKSHQVSPAEASQPEGAWQEEESLEVYRKKRTQRPSADGPGEIVRFVKHQPRSGEEVYETVRPHHDGRRELILLEPVRFGDESPETLYDDYSLYRMEEYVDAGTEICERDKEPVYYTIQKVQKAGQPVPEREKLIKEEVIAPAKEMETASFKVEEHETMEKRSSREELTSYLPPAPLHERGPYVCTVPIGDVSLERCSDAGRSEKSCSQSSELMSKERRKETPIFDRTVFYEREISGNGKSAEREVRERHDSRASSRQTFVVDDEIAHANKRIDHVFRGTRDNLGSRGSPVPIRTLPTVAEEDFNRENFNSFKKTSEHLVKEYKEMCKELSKKEETAAPKLQAPSRASSTGYRPERLQSYERTTQAPPSSSPSAAPSIRSAVRASYCPHCLISTRESDRLYQREPSVTREVPVQKERYSSATQKCGSNNDKRATDFRFSAPIQETITTERYERIEKVKKVFPATAV